MTALILENMSFSILDAVLAVLIIISLVTGILKGIIKSIAWLPGLILGYIAVIFFNKMLTTIFIENSILPPMWASLVSVLILMGGVYLVVRLIACIFASFLEEVGLSAIDRILGGLFSFSLCIIVLGFITVAIDNLSVFEGFRGHLDASWIVTHIIRPFYEATLNVVKEAI